MQRSPIIALARAMSLHSILHESIIDPHLTSIRFHTPKLYKQKWQDRSKYTPAMIKDLAAERGVGRPPAVLASRRA